eukprot:c24084_g5_i1 orf=1-1659(-)
MESSRAPCQICGDEIQLSSDGEHFVACPHCHFPVCKACFDYESKVGTGACANCKRKYEVDADAGDHAYHEEEETEDLDHEYGGDLSDKKKQQIADAMLHGQMSYGRAEDHDMPRMVQTIEPQDPSDNLSISSKVGNTKKIHPFPYSSDIDSQAGDNAPENTWKERVEAWKVKQKLDGKMPEGGHPNSGRKNNDIHDIGVEDEESPVMDEARQPLSRKVSLPSSKINPYRMVIIFRLVILGFFFRYRLMNPVAHAYGLWLTSIICEIWFALSWILDQFPKWLPINRETYLDRLALRYEKEGGPSLLASVDIFVSTVDPMKEPPLNTANTVLSILAVDYPVDKVSCYVSDDGSAMLTFEAMSETSEFARKWVPFCKNYNIEPRAPEVYFAQKVDYLKDKVQPTFVKERRAMKREYEEFKVRINGLVAKAQKVPEGGWIMKDGTPWPGNNNRDHPGMIQVFLGHSGGLDAEGNELPRLVYVSREKRPGFNHHKKAGAMNALVRVSAVLTNAPFFLNLDCDHYINNSKALREAMCFLMDPIVGRKVCYVQFPQRFDG